MGKFIGGLITSKKRKKLNRKLQVEFGLQAAAAKEERRVEQLRANFSVQQERIQQLRNARILRATILSSGVNAGAGQSSSMQSGMSSAFTQATSNIGKLNVVQGFSAEMSRQNELFAASQTRAGVIQQKQENLAAKAEMIGGAIDLGLTVATLPFGGASGATRSIFTK